MSIADPFAGIAGPVRAALEQRGFASLTAVQRAVLAADAEGHNLRISSKTGSGKTVALGLALAPSLPDDHVSQADGADSPRAAGPQALVITPTRELAMQVCGELEWLYAGLPNTRVGVVTGGTDISRERRMLRRAPSVLVGTPGRLLDHLRSGSLSCANTRHVALDEADRMLEMGFRDELEAIIDALPEDRRSHLVSATFSGVMRRVADRFQGRDALHLEGTALGEANHDIDHVAQLVLYEDRYAALVNALLLAKDERVLVFVERRAGASDLAERLAGDGFAALPFSGELSQAQRTRTLHAFRTGTVHVLVSTDVAARGIDVPDISTVVHMSPPQDPDAYTHRSGRTGRAGRRGKSLMLVPPRGQRYVQRLLAAAKIEVDWQPAPTPAKLHKALTKRHRKQLHRRLEAEPGPGEKHLAYASRLLEKHSAEAVIAALLEMAEPQLPCEPMPVKPILPNQPPPREVSGVVPRDRRPQQPRSASRSRRSTMGNANVSGRPAGNHR